MSEAIIFEWTSDPPPAKHKHLTMRGTETPYSSQHYVTTVLIPPSLIC